jgi:hypothetical protein
MQPNVLQSFQQLVAECYFQSAEGGWWPEDVVNNPLVVPAKLALVHSELSEALEGHRKDLDDDHLPEFKAITVELADAVIRICDLAGALKLPLADAIAKKLQYNRTRLDHKAATRAEAHGKKY